MNHRFPLIGYNTKVRLVPGKINVQISIELLKPSKGSYKELLHGLIYKTEPKISIQNKNVSLFGNSYYCINNIFCLKISTRASNYNCFLTKDCEQHENYNHFITKIQNKDINNIWQYNPIGSPKEELLNRAFENKKK